MASIAGDIDHATPSRKWDPVVRITHWSIMAAVIANALVTEDGSAAHIWVGYGLAAILALRLIWGVIGPREARFTAFPPSPSRAIAHVKAIMAGDKTAHASHNPLGALMVYAIWATLAVITGSGIAMAGLPGSPAKTEGVAAAGMTQPRDVAASAGEDDNDAKNEARAGTGGEEEEGPMAEVHEIAVNLLYALILLHLAGVAFETRRTGRNIVMAMLTRRG